MYRKYQICRTHIYIYMARTCNSGIHVTMRYSTVYKLLFSDCYATAKPVTQRNPARINVNHQTYTHNMVQAQTPFFGASSTFFSATRRNTTFKSLSLHYINCDQDQS